MQERGNKNLSPSGKVMISGPAPFSRHAHTLTKKIFSGTLHYNIQYIIPYIIIGGGTCLKVGGPRKIVKFAEMHVQMRACNNCNHSQYCLMFLFN